MKHLVIIATLGLAAVPAIAQQQTGAMAASGGHDMSAGHEHMMQTDATAPVSEPGQGAFAAIAEIVAALEADPETDWARVDIGALRAHLRDMDLVTIWAKATGEDIPGGMRFTVTGEGDVADAIERMVLAHAAVMQDVNGWTYVAASAPGGAVLEVTVPEADLPRLKALGFFGVLASGMHHQSHHWMMATGANPHR